MPSISHKVQFNPERRDHAFLTINPRRPTRGRAGCLQQTDYELLPLTWSLPSVFST